MHNTIAYQDVKHLMDSNSEEIVGIINEVCKSGWAEVNKACYGPGHRETHDHKSSQRHKSQRQE